MNRFNNFLNGMRTPKKIVVSRGGLIGIALGIIACLTTPLWAASFFFATRSPNDQMGALSRRASPGKVETETADDFLLQDTTVITDATIAGLLPAGTPLDNIKDVEVEISTFSLWTPRSLSQGRCPCEQILLDVEIGTATRARSSGTLEISTRVLNGSFMVANTVANGITVKTSGAGTHTTTPVEIQETSTDQVLTLSPVN